MTTKTTKTKTKTQTQMDIADARVGLKNLLAAVKAQRLSLKYLESKDKDERRLAKIVREDHRKLRAEKIAAKRADAIAKAEARLAKMKLKAQKKNGAVKVYSADEIAAINAAA